MASKTAQIDRDYGPWENRGTGSRKANYNKQTNNKKRLYVKWLFKSPQACKYSKNTIEIN